MIKRFALFRGKKGQLVGHPGQSPNGASYICQRQLPMPEGGLKGFGTPGYSGPELCDLYEPTIELVELTQSNARTLEKAVRAGHLDRSEIAHFPDRETAEKSREKLEASLLAAVQKRSRDAAAAAAKRATEQAQRAEAAVEDKSLARERALLARLEAAEQPAELSPGPAVTEAYPDPITTPDEEQ